MNRYEVEVDYVNSTTIIVDAEDESQAKDAVWVYLESNRGMRSVLRSLAENPNNCVDAFDIAYVIPSSAIGSDAVRADDYLGKENM